MRKAGRLLQALATFWLKGALLAFGWWLSAVVIWGGLSIVSAHYSLDGIYYDPIADVADRLIPIFTWMRRGTRLLLILLMPVHFALFYYWFVRPLSRGFADWEQQHVA